MGPGIPGSNFHVAKVTNHGVTKTNVAVHLTLYLLDTSMYLKSLSRTPEGFTTMVANEGRDRELYIPSEGCDVNFR